VTVVSCVGIPEDYGKPIGRRKRLPTALVWTLSRSLAVAVRKGDCVNLSDGVVHLDSLAKARLAQDDAQLAMVAGDGESPVYSNGQRGTCSAGP